MRQRQHKQEKQKAGEKAAEQRKSRREWRRTANAGNRRKHAAWGSAVDCLPESIRRKRRGIKKGGSRAVARATRCRVKHQSSIHHAPRRPVSVASFLRGMFSAAAGSAAPPPFAVCAARSIKNQRGVLAASVRVRGEPLSAGIMVGCRDKRPGRKARERRR